MLKGFRNSINKIIPLSKRFLILGALIVGSLILLAIALEILWALLGFPIWKAVELLRDQEGVSLFEVVNTAQPLILEGLKAALPGLSGLALSGTAFAAISNLRVSEDTRRIAEEKQVTDLFVKAVEMLGDKEREVLRIGGIYALERIARNSKKDHWTVMEVLTSFIEERSPNQTIGQENQSSATQREEKTIGSFVGLTSDPAFDALLRDLAKAIVDPINVIDQDIQAAINVIGRRETENDRLGSHLTFSKVNLKGANMSSARLFNAFFNGAALDGVALDGAFLDGVSFQSSSLSWSRFCKSSLIRAKFSFCDLREANFANADLQDAELGVCDLRGASFANASLHGVTISGAYTDISKADFRGVKGLDPEEIKKATNWEHAIYDHKFAKQLGISDEQIEVAEKTARKQVEVAEKFAKKFITFKGYRISIKSLELAQELAANPAFAEHLEPSSQDTQDQTNEPETSSDTSG